MRVIFSLLIAIALVVERGGAECPASHEEVPTLYDNDTFSCAMTWEGLGDDNSLNSCTSCSGWDGVAAGL